ncbi:uncharacterized protein LOC132301361 [Cornus florida]|uniref:uncharacterized protein LOC132301361 n=1 Tax=Cornus florida TaxID=4283 RepID=UPI00289AC619|nr:uncharacterized protein LOC132301361 [Cornus florida]
MMFKPNGLMPWENESGREEVFDCMRKGEIAARLRKLSFYPNGNKKRKGKDQYISLYLAVSDTANLPSDWEIIANFKLFVFDHLRDKYLTVEDAEPVRRFHGNKTEWGFEKFLSLKKFQNLSNGYVINDTCVFGAEVFVMKYSGKGECLSMTKLLSNKMCLSMTNLLSNKIYTWKVDKFSDLIEEYLRSNEFKIGGRSCCVISHSITADEVSVPPTNISYKKQNIVVSVCFHCSQADWGLRRFMLLSDLHDDSKGFLVND